MTHTEQAAYDSGTADAREGKRFTESYSDDWSVQREYENGFHGRPRWY